MLAMWATARLSVPTRPLALCTSPRSKRHAALLSVAVCARLLSQRIEHGRCGKAASRPSAEEGRGCGPAAQGGRGAHRSRAAGASPQGQQVGKMVWRRDRAPPRLHRIDAAWLLKLANGEVMPERKGVEPAWQDVPPEAKLSLTALRKTTMGLKLPIAVLSYGWAGRGHCDPTEALLRRLKPVLERMAHCCQHGGWCIFVKALSSVRKFGDCCLQLSLLEGMGTVNEFWQGLVIACQASRAAPLAPPTPLRR